MPLIKFILPYLPEEVISFLQKYQIQYSWVTDPKDWVWVVLIMGFLFFLVSQAQKRISNLPEFLGMVKGNAMAVIVFTLLIGPKLPLYILIFKWLLWGFNKAREEMAYNENKTRRQKNKRKERLVENPSTVQDQNQGVAISTVVEITGVTDIKE